MSPETERIRALNDAFRTTLQGGKFVVTATIKTLPLSVQLAAFKALKDFSTFPEDDDPENEHDFGSFEIAGETFFWKIDYYDLSMEFGSENPADPTSTTRVLTFMLAEDY